MARKHASPTQLVKPTPRPGIYDLYWIFASRRHAVFERRTSGARGPWSDDSILQTFKFCNVFRAADRVSQYLIANVAYSPESGSFADRVFQIVAFRMFSNTATWEGVCSELGRSPRLTDLASGAFEQALAAVKGRLGKLYTGAFILCANNAFGFKQKYRNHVALFARMFLKDKFAHSVAAAPSLKHVVSALEEFPLIGPFMAYQIAIDLNYSELIDFSENSFTQAGPGAMRGLKKVFVDLGDYSPADTILWMTDRQEKEFRRLELPFAGLFGRPLHAIDCQGLFCEVDKYCRKAAPELVSNRTRIKARFKPSPVPLSLFFPPKWGLSVPRGSVATGAHAGARRRPLDDQGRLFPEGGRTYDGEPRLLK